MCPLALSSLSNSSRTSDQSFASSLQLKGLQRSMSACASGKPVSKDCSCASLSCRVQTDWFACPHPTTAVTVNRRVASRTASDAAAWIRERCATTSDRIGGGVGSCP